MNRDDATGYLLFKSKPQPVSPLARFTVMHPSPITRGNGPNAAPVQVEILGVLQFRGSSVVEHLNVVSRLWSRLGTMADGYLLIRGWRLFNSDPRSHLDLTRESPMPLSDSASIPLRPALPGVGDSLVGSRDEVSGLSLPKVLSPLQAFSSNLTHSHPTSTNGTQHDGYL